MKSSSGESTARLVGNALLVALVIVLQIVSSNVRFGPFTITLTLIPVVIGGILYGAGSGAMLGAIFGAMVTFFSIIGVEGGGNIMFQYNPILTVLTCMLKGTAAGLIPAWVYPLIARKNKSVAAVVSAMLAPVCNTGIFLFFALVFFRPVMEAWASGLSMVIYVITGLVGVNFLVEFAVSTVLSPVVVTVTKVIRSTK